MILRRISVEIQPMSEYSTVREHSVLRKNVNEKLDLLEYAIHKNSYRGLSIYKLGEISWINTTLKDESKRSKPFAFISGVYFFSDNSSISRRFVKYKRYKRGSHKYKSYIRNLMFFYNF